MKSLYSTLVFFFARVKKLEPTYIRHQMSVSMMTIVEILWYVFVPSYLIQMLSDDVSQNTIILRMMGCVIGLFVVRLIRRFSQIRVLAMNTRFSNKITQEVSQLILDVPFRQIEDPAFVQQKEEALFPLNNFGVASKIMSSLPSIFQSLFVLVSVASLILFYDPLILVIVIGVSALSFLVNQRMIRLEAKEAKTSTKQNNEYVYYLRLIRDQAIAKDMRIYQMQPFFLKRVQSLFEFYVASSKLLYHSRDLREIVNRLMSLMLMVFAYVYLLYRTMQSGLNPSDFVLVVNATINFGNQINILLNEFLVLHQQMIYLTPLSVFYEMIETSKIEGDILLSQSIETIEFKAVTFSYPHSDKVILNDCNFTLDQRKSFSLVGLNGSGKTTLIKLLSRLYKVDSGEILVNGINIEEYQLSSYLKQLSIIFQDFKTFHYTLEDNIVLGQEHNIDRLEQAIYASELGVEKDKWKHGLQTKIGNDFDKEGISLSKGQEQKLAIARSIYRESSLFILDEPTASLDPIAEEEVYKHFREITKDKLAIFISHRLSSCRFSDEILYLENGEVAEQGSHMELMKKQGRYASLFKLQAEHYQ